MRNPHYEKTLICCGDYFFNRHFLAAAGTHQHPYSNFVLIKNTKLIWKEMKLVIQQSLQKVCK